MKVLFLSAWYPTKQDAMAGLFVQKHAEAVACQGVDVRVLFSEATGGRWLGDMFRSWVRLKREWGLPDIVQMNVLDKNGVLALWLRQRYHIPYIVVEHWSGYLPANFSFRGGLHSLVMKFIARKAECILPVSQVLEKAMKKCGITNRHWERLNNVVDDFFYEEASNTIPRDKKFRILHVSCFDERAKNIQGILRAVRKATEIRQDFEFVVVGTGIDYAKDKAYADSLHFPTGMLHFTGEQTPKEVCTWMQSSDAFVLFSRYETFSIVLAECLAVGLPIITSQTVGIADTLTNECGLKIPTEDEPALRDAVLYMLDHLQDYPKNIIRPYGKAYRYDTVGMFLKTIYQQVILHSEDRAHSSLPGKRTTRLE